MSLEDLSKTLTRISKSLTARKVSLQGDLRVEITELYLVQPAPNTILGGRVTIISGNTHTHTYSSFEATPTSFGYNVVFTGLGGRSVLLTLLSQTVSTILGAHQGDVDQVLQDPTDTDR